MCVVQLAFLRVSHPGRSRLSLETYSQARLEFVCDGVNACRTIDRGVSSSVLSWVFVFVLFVEVLFFRVPTKEEVVMRRRSTIKLLFVAALGFFVWAILLAYPLVVSEEDVTIVSSGGAAKEDVAASTTELAEDMRISTETAALFNAFVLHPDFAKQGFCDLAARANLSAEMQRAAATPYNLQSWELSCSPTAPACTSFSTRRWVQYWEKAAQRISPHADAPTLAQRSCDNILLRNAPWCGFNLTQLMAPLLFRHLVHPNQVPPVVAAPDAQQYFSSASDADLLEAVKRNAQDILE